MTRCLHFRLGCHHLRIHTGQWQQPRLPRRACVCLRCSLNVVDDEAHCLLACPGPTLQQQRELLLSSGWWTLTVCARVRNSGRPWITVVLHSWYLATCLRVAWHCHISGPAAVPGSPVVVDEYPDLFDGESDLDTYDHMLSDYGDG